MHTVQDVAIRDLGYTPAKERRLFGEYGVVSHQQIASAKISNEDKLYLEVHILGDNAASFLACGLVGDLAPFVVAGEMSLEAIEIKRQLLDGDRNEGDARRLGLLANRIMDAGHALLSDHDNWLLAQWQNEAVLWLVAGPDTIYDGNCIWRAWQACKSACFAAAIAKSGAARYADIEGRRFGIMLSCEYRAALNRAALMWEVISSKP